MYTTSHEETTINEKGEEVTSTVTEYFLHSHEPSYEDIINENIPEDLTPLVPAIAGSKLPAIESYSESTGIYTYKGIDGYLYDSYEYRLYKFRKEFDDYFESDLTMVYYIISEFLLMTDSRAKNMMLCTFTARCTDRNGASKTKWFPIFYDMDTGLAVNNMG